MLVKFQVVHKLKKKDFIEVIQSAVNLINNKIYKEHPLCSNEENLPINPIFTYHTEHTNCLLSGLCLDLSKYVELYYDDYVLY